MVALKRLSLRQVWLYYIIIAIFGILPNIEWFYCSCLLSCGLEILHHNNLTCLCLRVLKFLILFFPKSFFALLDVTQSRQQWTFWPGTFLFWKYSYQGSGQTQTDHTWVDRQFEWEYCFLVSKAICCSHGNRVLSYQSLLLKTCGFSTLEIECWFEHFVKVLE